jgi:hypothetical protein
VAAFSFYGELKSMYYEGIEANARSLEVGYMLRDSDARFSTYPYKKAIYPPLKL